MGERDRKTTAVQATNRSGTFAIRALIERFSAYPEYRLLPGALLVEQFLLGGAQALGSPARLRRGHLDLADLELVPAVLRIPCAAETDRQRSTGVLALKDRGVRLLVLSEALKSSTSNGDGALMFHSTSASTAMSSWQT
jgi:hypothetical protein